MVEEVTKEILLWSVLVVSFIFGAIWQADEVYSNHTKHDLSRDERISALETQVAK